MLYIELKINHKVIRTIGVRNVSPVPIHKSCTAECPYEIWDLTDLTNPLERTLIGKLRHTRRDGAEVLASKVLEMVADYDEKNSTI